MGKSSALATSALVCHPRLPISSSKRRPWCLACGLRWRRCGGSLSSRARRLLRVIHHRRSLGSLQVHRDRAVARSIGEALGLYRCIGPIYFFCGCFARSFGVFTGASRPCGCTIHWRSLGSLQVHRAHLFLLRLLCTILWGLYRCIATVRLHDPLEKPWVFTGASRPRAVFTNFGPVG